MDRRRRLFITAPFAAPLFATHGKRAQIATESSAVLDIGRRLEPFVDRYLIDRLNGTSLQLHPARPAEVVLRFDRPWEGEYAAFPYVIKDGDRYHLYYRGLPQWAKGEKLVESTCYAFSTDGINWTRPSLRRYELKRNRENNALFDGSGFTPFLDTRSGVPASHRFKALKAPPRLNTSLGITAYVSSDWIRWERLREEPVMPADQGPGELFWSETEQCYVQYARLNVEKSHLRSISRCTSKDFLNWSEWVPMHFGDTPAEHLYTNGTQPYFRAPHLYISLAARFMPGRRALTDEQVRTLHDGDPSRKGYWSDCSDAVLMTSRGGTKYDRTFMAAFVRPGLGYENWVTRSNYPGVGIVPTGPAEMSFYVVRHYGQPSSHILRYVLRTDGFASIRAGYNGGELLTKLFSFRGRQLSINYSTSAAGSVRIEVQDKSGKPIPRFALDDCPEIIGDEIQRVVTWRGRSDVGVLEGRPIRLRFALKDADLYSICFG